MKSHSFRRTYKLKNKTEHGQTLVASVGLLAVASVMLFFVFNSGRAVNEKINLVNAADAAAYSGAQVAARHLNFMAYTNRAMIANEVAIGHIFSYQVETEILGDALTQTIMSNLPAAVGFRQILSWISPQFAANLESFFQDLVNASKVATSMLMLMMNSNTKKFNGFQEQAYLDLITQVQRPELNGQSLSIVGATMQVVANTYAVRDNAPVQVNNQLVLADFVNDTEVDPAVSDAALSAARYDEDLCAMILFAQPSGLGSDVPAAGQAACQGLVSGAQRQVQLVDGDGGHLIEAITQTYTEMDNGVWIRDRNMNYNWLGLPVSRVGSTTLRSVDDHISWGTNRDSIQIGGFAGTGLSGDVNSFIEDAGNILDQAGLTALSNMGLCQNGVDENGNDCRSILNEEYRSIDRYAVLNSDNDRAVITAFLNQDNCSDSIGFDEEGNRISGWNDNLRLYEQGDEKVCGKTVYALARAEVYYQRPDCYATDGNCSAESPGFQALDAEGSVESANLYNPFWHVRLVQ